jgi:hypothetical protein
MAKPERINAATAMGLDRVDVGFAQARATAPTDATSMAASFTAGTRITTIAGPKPIEDLCNGDLVLTMDNGYRPVQSVGIRQVAAASHAMAEHLRPIRIKAGALGAGFPACDLTVAPEQRVLLRVPRARALFGEAEVLVPARALLIRDGVEVASDNAPVTYAQLTVGHHEIVFANGMPTETLFRGHHTVRPIPSRPRRQALSNRPEIAMGDPCPPVARVRPDAKDAVDHLLRWALAEDTHANRLQR